MNTKERKQDRLPLVDFKRLRLFVIYPVLAVLGLWVCSVWLPPAFYGLSIKRTLTASAAPLLKQAKESGFTYEKVLEDPAGAEGKPVAWCVRNRSSQDVTVDGEENKRLAVFNHPMMPVFMGDKHQSCTPMLLVVEKTAPGGPVSVFFKEALY